MFWNSCINFDMHTNKTINISFCFDKRFLMQTCVAITSLLVSANNKCAYRIYCIISADLSEKDLQPVRLIVSNFSKNSRLIFLYKNSNYDNAYIPANKGEWSKAVYYRLMLPDLLPDIDKIIYLDSDTIILKDLTELDNMELNDNLLLGCLDFLNNDILWKQRFNNYWLALDKNKCFNTGMLVMNLKKIREEKLSQKWIELAKKEIRCVDQDVLNSTCLGKIGLLDTVYNRAVVDKTKIKSIITEEEFNKTVIMHYVYPKPWFEKSLYSDIWWKFAKMTEFYEQLRLNYSITMLKRTKVSELPLNTDFTDI